MQNLWEKPFSAYNLQQRGDAYKKRKRITKTQLAQRLKKGDKMPVIQTEVRESADDVVIGETYEIIETENIITEARQFSGVRVVMKTQTGKEGTVMLWQRKITGKTSKLGVFLILLGHDTDKWLHKWIRFNKWAEKAREVELVPALKLKGK